MSIQDIEEKIKALLSNFSQLTTNILKIDEEQQAVISYKENPLNPNLLAYCFDNTLGFDVQYRIAEKVNYIIDFSYKGYYGSAKHFKMSYNVILPSQFKEEVILIFENIKLLLEDLFMLIGKEALTKNSFSMDNEAPNYLRKLMFYENKIDSLYKRKNIVSEKANGMYDIVKHQKYTSCIPKCQKYLRDLSYEITYNIESYIDTFFSALEHILTLLCPFVHDFSNGDSYYYKYIKNTKWTWEKKINDACEGKFPVTEFDKLKRIKEVYRNHNAHGGFSREMMAYVGIPGFGNYPMYIGKEYLKGFINYEDSAITYEMYLEAKEVFKSFWEYLECNYELYMMYIKSGLVVPIDTSYFKNNVSSKEDAQYFIDKMWYDIDNQSNMDW